MREPYAQALGSARERCTTFLQSLSPARRVVVFCHFDADGLSAGAIFGRGLRRLGFSDVRVLPSLRGESAFSAQAGRRISAHNPAALIVTDLGVHSTELLPRVPTMLVDHHQPASQPRDAVAVISGYGWEPIPCSAWIAYDLLAPLVDLDDLAWIAATGILSDLGDKAPWPELAAVKKRYTAKWLREAVALINAARRASRFDTETPLGMLMEVEHPRAVSEDERRGANRLRAYRVEVNAELHKARRQAPIFARGQPFALIKFSSACQIHPLIAQQWRGRLRDYAVLAANSGYMPGVVAFSARTRRGDMNLPVRLKAVDLGELNERFGFGHDQASGGHLPPFAFNRLVAALGFDARANFE